MFKGIQRRLQLRLDDELEANNRTFSVFDRAFFWISLDNLAWMFKPLIKDRACWKLAFNIRRIDSKYSHT